MPERLPNRSKAARETASGAALPTEPLSISSAAYSTAAESALFLSAAAEYLRVSSVSFSLSSRTVRPSTARESSAAVCAAAPSASDITAESASIALRPPSVRFPAEMRESAASATNAPRSDFAPESVFPNSSSAKVSSVRSVMRRASSAAARFSSA